MDINLVALNGKLDFEFSENLQDDKINELENKISQITKFIFDNFECNKSDKISIKITENDIEVEGIKKEDTQKISNLLKEIYILRKTTNKDINIVVKVDEQIHKLVHKEKLIFNTHFKSSKILDKSKISAPVKQSDISLFDKMSIGLNELSRYLKRTFTYYTEIKPLLNSKLNKLVEMPPSDYRKHFVNIIDKADSFTKSLKEQNPDISSLFDDKELMSIFESELIKKMNESLKNSNLPLLQASEIRKFKVTQSFNLVSDPKCPPHILAKELHKIQSGEMPLERLRDIRATSKNKEILAKTWERVLAESYTRGSLDKVGSPLLHKERLIQAEYGAKFIRTLELIPPGLATLVEPTKNQLLKNVSLDKLKNLIIQENAFFNSPIALDDIKLVEKQKIYAAVVRPVIDEIIKEAIDNEDSSELALILALESDHNTQFIQKINLVLTKNEAAHFSAEELNNLFYHEVERVAISEYYFTSTQIENLRKNRNQILEIKNEKQLIENAIDDYEVSIDKIEETYNKKLINIRQNLLNPLVDLPSLTIPLVLASEDDKNAIITIIKDERKEVIKKSSPGNLKRLEKEIDKLEKEHKNLNKKRKTTEIAKKLTELESQIKQQTDEWEELKKIAANSNDYLSENNILEKLNTMQNIPVKAHSRDVRKLSPLHLQALEQKNNELIHEIVELNKQIKGLTQKKQIKPLEDRVAELNNQKEALDKLFLRIKELNIQHESEKEIEANKQEAIIQALAKQIAQLQNNLGKIDNFPAIFSNLRVTKNAAPIAENAYEFLTSQLLNDKRLSIINNMRSEVEIKREVLLIVEARERLELLPFMSKEAEVRIENLFSQFEGKITNNEAKNLLQKKSSELILPWKIDLYLGDDVANNLLEEGFDHPGKIPVSAVSDLIIITQMLARIDIVPPEELTIPQKTKLVQSLERLSKTPNLIDILSKFEESDNKEGLGEHIPSLLKKFIPQQNSIQYKIPSGITQESIDLVKSYLSMIEQYKSLSTPLKKAESLLNKYRKKEPIQPEERIIYRDVAKISKLARFGDQKNSPLATLKKFGITDHPNFHDFQEKVTKAVEIRKELDSILLPAYAKHYQDGDIFGYAGKRKEAWIGHSLQGEERMTMFIADYGLTHGMKVYHKDDHTVNVSHVYGNYKDEKLDLYHVAISEGWRINVRPLITDSVAKALEKAMGPDWEKQVQTSYHAIEKVIQQNIKNRFEDIENDDLRRLNAGLADFHPLFNLFGGFKGNKVLGHHQEHEQDFTPIYKQFMKGDPVTETQICSEFVSKSTLAALTRVNRQLAKILAQKYPEFTYQEVLKKLDGTKIDESVREYLSGKRHFGPKRDITKNAEEQLKKILEQAGFAKNQIELIIRINNKEIFELPWERTERLMGIHPGRMISILEKRKCVEKIPEPKEFTDLIQMV